MAEFSEAYFARMAELEDKHPWTRHMRQVTLDLLTRAGGDACKRRLDVGCGTGLFLENWRRRGHAERLTGVDFASAALDFARSRTEAEWITASAASLPLRTGSFDALHSADVLQHLGIREVGCAFDEFARVLRPGGLLALRLRGPRWLTGIPDKDFAVTFTPALVRQYLEGSHFRVGYLSLVNTLPSLVAELRERMAPARAGSHAPVKGITCHAQGDPRSAGLALYLRMERVWSYTLGLPLPFGHTIICIAKKLG